MENNASTVVQIMEFALHLRLAGQQRQGKVVLGLSAFLDQQAEPKEDFDCSSTFTRCIDHGTQQNEALTKVGVTTQRNCNAPRSPF